MACALHLCTVSARLLVPRWCIWSWSHCRARFFILFVTRQSHRYTHSHTDCCVNVYADRVRFVKGASGSYSVTQRSLCTCLHFENRFYLIRTNFNHRCTANAASSVAKHSGKTQRLCAKYVELELRAFYSVFSFRISRSIFFFFANFISPHNGHYTNQNRTKFWLHGTNDVGYNFLLASDMFVRILFHSGWVFGTYAFSSCEP